jgi:hypothetical protein
MHKRYSLLIAASVAALAIPVAASPAAAADYHDNCWTGGALAGANGAGQWNYASRTKLDPLTLRVEDIRADSHSVGVRLVTRRSNGTDHVWSWHRLYAGSGNSESWGTSASDSAGIRKAWVQVGVFEGNSLVESCVTSFGTNPRWS